jgi:hypothetical protein
MSNLFPGQFSPLGFQTLTLTNSAAQSLTVPSNAKYALIQAVTNPVNWRDDGTAPTASVGNGMVMPVSVEPMGFSGDLSAIKFTSTAAGGSTLLASFYG